MRNCDFWMCLIFNIHKYIIYEIFFINEHFLTFLIQLHSLQELRTEKTVYYHSL